MRNRPVFFWLIGLIVVLPIMGYALVHGLTLVADLNEQPSFNIILIYLLFIALLLAVPFWMLKMGGKAAHLRNSEEEEIELQDIPKDQGQFIQSKHAHR